MGFTGGRPLSQKGCTTMQLKLLGGVGAILAAALAGSAAASAAPDMSAIANSTCSYQQVVSALTAQSPDAANRLTSSPVATAWLQRLVAAPPDQRQQMIADVQGLPAMQQYTGLINQVAGSCNNY